MYRVVSGPAQYSDGPTPAGGQCEATEAVWVVDQISHLSREHPAVAGHTAADDRNIGPESAGNAFSGNIGQRDTVDERLKQRKLAASEHITRCALQLRGQFICVPAEEVVLRPAEPAQAFAAELLKFSLASNRICFVQTAAGLHNSTVEQAFSRRRVQQHPN